MKSGGPNNSIKQSGKGSKTKTPHPSSNGNNKQEGIPKWRIKYRGNKIEQDGKTMVWCKNHKKEGEYDGMYCPKLHDHAAWEKRVKKNKEMLRAKREKQKEIPLNSSSYLSTSNEK
eukprot:5532500-Ditylum_brightwellii.AAC.1